MNIRPSFSRETLPGGSFSGVLSGLTTCKSSMPLLKHSTGSFASGSRVSVVRLIVAAAIAALVPVTASGAHAQAARATSPASDDASHSWVHESWTVKDGLPRRRSKLHAH